MTDAEYLKQWLKAHGWKYRDVANGVYRSVSWIGDVVRGNYPWYQGGRVPKNIWDWAKDRGMPEPQRTEQNEQRD